MLTYLKIENLALIEHSEVEFGGGFNVITGETGAGKSILLGAIELLLGGRADRTVIRTGAERCEICGIFQLMPEYFLELEPILCSAEIPFDRESGELQLRRIITENSGRCHINNTPVTVRLMRELGELLIDVHGANEHQSLTSTAKQLTLLDRYAHSEVYRQKCASICAEISALKDEQSRFESQMPSATEAAHLSMIIDEISSVNPQANEDEELSRRHALASNSRQIMEDTARLGEMLTDGEEAIANTLTQVYRTIQELVRLDEQRGSELLERCAVISESVQELAGEVADFGSDVDLNEAEYMELEERLSLLHTLKRRYGPSLEQVFALWQESQERLDDYRRGGAKRAEFAKKEELLHKKLLESAQELTIVRKEAAERLAVAVREKLGAIGFIAGAIVPDFTTVEAGANGQDIFELYFSANTGEEPQPLRKIASSGELSRLMLALKTVLSDADHIPVAIFDEIDVNIGGETACAVGEELHALGERRQLLAISHLPQVAVRGDRHFAVSKFTEDERTFSEVVVLKGAKRTEEIARMLGGSKAALSHAKELIRESAK